MEFVDGLNAAIDYIEENIEGEVDTARAARLAACSEPHFMRMFGYIAGIPLGEYLRRRRMSLAGAELAAGSEKVIDLALKYGYESPTAFNRAFKAVHGISPSEARKNGAKLVSFPRITFTISVKGEVQMDYSIVKKEAFRIVGKAMPLGGNVEESYAAVPQFWQKCASDGSIPRVCALMDGSVPGLLGVSTYQNKRDTEYMIGVATSSPKPEDMTEYTVPACTWAVFECVGAMPQSIQALQRKVFTEWLPSSGYAYAEAPDIEVYFEGDQQSPDYRCQVWLPVVKK